MSKDSIRSDVMNAQPKHGKAAALRKQAILDRLHALESRGVVTRSSALHSVLKIAAKGAITTEPVGALAGRPRSSSFLPA